MDNSSSRADQDRKQRSESQNFLFITVPGMENPEELEGIAMGKNIKEFNNLLGKKKDKEIYKLFKEYIRTKIMNIEVLKDVNQWQMQVDKLYKEENNLICISAIENKFPPMDMYYTVKPAELKQDFEKFLNNYKIK
jgi:hypothetical protein